MVQPTNQIGNTVQPHNQSVNNISSLNLDPIAQNQAHSMSVHANPIGQRDNSFTELDSFLNEKPRTGNKKNQDVGQTGTDDIDKLDLLLKKLIDTKKITKKQLI